MDTIFLIFLAVVLVVLGLALGYFWAQRRLSNVSSARDVNLQKNLEKIMALFAQHPTLTNMLIRQKLGFDDRTVVRYMDELERQGRVEQEGKTGTDVVYRKKS